MKKINAFDGMSLPEIVAQSYPVDDLKEQSFNTLEKLFDKKSVSIELQEKIKKAVDIFWKNFNILP